MKDKTKSRNERGRNNDYNSIRDKIIQTERMKPQLRQSECKLW